jgi:hypothetical protein
METWLFHFQDLLRFRSWAKGTGRGAIYLRSEPAHEKQFPIISQTRQSRQHQ